MKTRLIPPCPIYDIDSMQSWLEEMASKGLFLTKLKIFATFETKTPRNTRYRIEALPKKAGLFSNKNVDPVDEAIAMMEAFGWKYVDTFNELAIYMTEDKSIPEPHTDETLHATVINHVIRNNFYLLIPCLFFIPYFLLAFQEDGFFGNLMIVGPWCMIGFIICNILFIFNAIAPLCYLLKSKKKMNKDVSTPKKRSFPSLYSLSPILLFISSIMIVLGMLSLDDINRFRTPIDDYNETLPFATVSELFPEAFKITDDTNQMPFDQPNTLKISSNGVLDLAINYRENRVVKALNGKNKTVDLYVQYYDLKYQWMARPLAKDLYQHDKKAFNIKETQNHQFPGEVAYAYHCYDDIVLIIIHQDQVLQVSFTPETIDPQTLFATNISKLRR